ncbi:MAG TPA: hypothetical protein VH724_21130 [Candidatus Angelobacter sp.]|jgi:hypothetical protein|nr:hypothetical protein [Candidatus Angelobacter sp.]
MDLNKVRPFYFIAASLLLLLAGCRSHVVKINLINTSTEPVKTIIVDYPTATFGKDALAPGATFSYAIKPLETGMFKVQFTDAKGSIHSLTGPMLHKNDDGSIDVKLDQSGAQAIPIGIAR